ncbi:ephrin-B2a [Oryzias latipes]|uniref:Ephrin RBD domain-containing protein n=1 Tax=Oryzias latipes TaxID=8090 RepID=H2LK03_ORYLA|nr:ephrin-B2a [Oryzias latipes]
MILRRGVFLIFPVMGRSAQGCAAVILLAIVCSCRAATLESILWSSSNTKFKAGKGLVLFPQIGDKMDIVCPRADGSPGGKEEFYKVYLVSRSQMESCTIEKMDTPLLNCDKPYRDVKFTFKFQEFSPNLWGLEFLKGRDYYITSTSTGFLRGLDNTNGGVCGNKSMKLVLRVGQNSSDPPSTLQESPTRYPPTPPKSKAKDASVKEKNIRNLDLDTGQTKPGGISSSRAGLFIWIVSGCVTLLLVIAVLLVVMWKYHQHRRVPDRQQQQQASLSLNTLAVPKRDSISSDNIGSDRSDIVFPLRASESMICRHYERVSGEYAPPVYIVQEIMPHSPTNVYYKV